jgi:hypothetical protein
MHHGTPRPVYACAFGLILAGTCVLSACARDTQAMTPERVEQQYGVGGAYTDAIPTPEGPMRSTVVPVTLADGRRAQLVIPARQANLPHGLYMRDSNGLHPVEMSDRVNRDAVRQAPAVVERRAHKPHAQKRSWEREALIIGGSAGGGALIGAAAGGKKGAAVGAAAGGIGGLIYDLATRDKN